MPVNTGMEIIAFFVAAFQQLASAAFEQVRQIIDVLATALAV
jgi:hypothetical protein